MTEDDAAQVVSNALKKIQDVPWGPGTLDAESTSKLVLRETSTPDLIKMVRTGVVEIIDNEKTRILIYSEDDMLILEFTSMESSEQACGGVKFALDPVASTKLLTALGDIPYLSPNDNGYMIRTGVFEYYDKESYRILIYKENDFFLFELTNANFRSDVLYGLKLKFDTQAHMKFTQAIDEVTWEQALIRRGC